MTPNDTLSGNDNSLRQALAELLRELLGSHARLMRLEVRKRMFDYRVVLVELDAPHLWLVAKLAGPGAALACPFERTAALLELVRKRTRVPVAEVMAVDARFERWPWRYLLTTCLPGVQWVKAREQMDDSERNVAYAQMGEAAAGLHALQFPGFGELSPNLDSPADCGFLAAWQVRAEDFIPDEGHRAAFLAALEPRSGLFAELGPAGLTHEDLHGYNILFERQARGWQLSAILDFDKAWAGCCESDLARMAFWDGMTGPTFWQAYTANLRINSGYAQRKLLFQLFWCLEYGETSPRHQADTTRVCRELGIPEISLRH